jgi:WD40 repeat protein
MTHLPSVPLYSVAISSRVLMFQRQTVWSPLLISGAAVAQEGKGWLGVDVQDVTKAEADKLKWDAPHGAKVGVVASGSPAENAGLKPGDIIDVADGVEIETSSAFERLIATKPPGTELRLRVLSGGSERRVSVTLAERPKVQAAQDQDGPLLMLDTGGHVALIRDLAFTPDGKQLVWAGDDKVIRIWDWKAGKTIRTIRGQVGPGSEGKIYAMALSPDARWQRPSLFDLLGSAFRTQFKETTNEPLPKRWAELIKHFNAQGRANHPAQETDPGRGARVR